MSHLVKPQLRPLDLIPIEMEGRKALCLRDPSGLTDKVAVVFEPMAVALGFLDGRHTLEQAHAKLRRYASGSIGLEDLRVLVAQLDEQFLLDSPRIDERRAELLLRYRRSPSRPAALAGMSYPADAGALRQYLDGFYTAAGGPGAAPAEACGPGIVAALAPHVDLGRGGPIFAHTYKRIAEDAGRPRRFVVLGTGHALAELVAATAKDFETPLGSLRCDRSFLESLQGRLDFDLFGSELTHRSEHSIEFQALYLSRLFEGRSDVTIVPILCGSFHEFIENSRSPRTSGQLESFVAAMRETLREHSTTPTVLLGAVDLSHLGPYYGDPEALSVEQRRKIEVEDRRMLEPVLRGDAEGFFSDVAFDGDRRRICGLSSIYLLLRCIDATRGELLGYAQADDASGTSIVSFSSVVFPAS